ncbi:MAG TPA: hypothetical protein PLU88_13020, partial [Armatimonadota bacterium]|nr:hypothetical protein [Armatimonadota bacterium]
GCAEREAKLAQDVAAHSKTLEQVTEELESASRIVEDHKSAYVELARAQAAKRTELESLKARQAELEAALAKYLAELESLEASSLDASNRQSEFSKRAEDLRERQKRREQELPPLRKQCEEAQAQISTVTKELDEINRQMVGKSSRLATLKEMAESHEGFFEGVRAVMAARKHGKLHGNYAVVADVITVPQGFETAVDVALGSAVQDVIADTVEDAKQAIRFLKENRAGRATFLPLDGIRPQVSSINGDFKKPGVLGIASDIISYDKRYSPAINVLLGRVVVVDNIDNAVKFSRSAAGWGKIVTLDGEVIVPTGAMTGGIRPGKGPNLLGRKQEMDTLNKELSKLEAARQKCEEAGLAARDIFASAGQKITELEQAAAADRLALVEAERQLEFLAQELKRISGQMEVVLLEKEEVQAALSSDSDALALLEEELSAAGQENIDLDTFVADAQKRVEDLSAHRESLSEELMEMSVTLASLRERKTGLEQSIRQTEALVTEIETELRNRRDEIGKQVNQSSVSIRERETLSEQQVQIEKTVSRLQSELEDLLNQRAQLSQSMSSVDTELKSLHHNRSETAELLRDCEVKEARLEVQISQTSQRLLEEYEISADEALARPEPEEVERGTATEVARLRKEIKSMGIVNTGAIQEYERIKERWEFLTTQKSDLEDARAKLQDAIREIDSGTRELFMDTFNNVAEHFDYMFKRLFGGGRTELVLTDPSNLLETGVEVIVQPPGKKLQNLLLLSGGERALTASALLFSLLMVRPSPFVMF